MSFTPLLADGGATLLIIVVVVVVVVGFLGWWLTDDSYRVILTASAGSMVHMQSITVTAILQKQNWAFGAWANDGGGFVVAVNAATAVLGPTPLSGATTAGAATATITVVGTNPGTDSLRVTFTPTGTTTKATAGVPLTVTPG